MDNKVHTHTADAKEVLRFQQHRIITLLFREHLMLLEDIANEHDIALDKLIAILPEDHKNDVDLADYLTPERSKQLRKRVLDRGNDTLRALDEILESFNISFQ